MVVAKTMEDRVDKSPRLQDGSKVEGSPVVSSWLEKTVGQETQSLKLEGCTSEVKTPAGESMRLQRDLGQGLLSSLCHLCMHNSSTFTRQDTELQSAPHKLDWKLCEYALLVQINLHTSCPQVLKRVRAELQAWKENKASYKHWYSHMQCKP